MIIHENECGSRSFVLVSHCLPHVRQGGRREIAGCYYLFGEITAMVEAREDHRLVQLQERQAAIELRSFLSFSESSIALLEASCHPHQGVVYLHIRTCI